MRFSDQDTINAILADKEIRRCIGAFFTLSQLDMIPDEALDMKLEQVREIIKMPWGDPFRAEDFINAANLTEDTLKNHTYQFITLWENKKKDYIPDFEKNDKASVAMYIRTSAIAHQNKCNPKKPAVIICPGGGYRMLASDSEGVQYADKMEENGYVPFILHYRVAPNLYPAPQEDLMRAVRYVRENADFYQIDPDNIMVMGSSAGGHLCASVAAICTEEASRPNKVCLCYPVISLLKETHEDSAFALTGNDTKLMEQLSVELHVTEHFPKTYIWVCADDSLVPPSNSIRMAKALEDKGVKHKLHVYPQGEHGCGLAFGSSAEGWIDEMMDFMKSKSETEQVLEFWNELHEEKDYKRNAIVVDDWLDSFEQIIDNCHTPILDLGCGGGNDILSLIQKKKQVIACDFSPIAIQSIKENFPEITDAKCFNMLDGLPFEDNTFELIIADLSLHFFLQKDTEQTISDIKRILKKKGHLLMRVNSINDLNHGAGQGEEIEKHVYRMENGEIKRFFDEEDIRFFFKDFTIECMKEEIMTRYVMEKKLYQVCVFK